MDGMRLSSMVGGLGADATSLLAVPLALVAHLIYKRFEPTALGFIFQSFLLSVVLFSLTNLSAAGSVPSSYSFRIWAGLRAILIYFCTLSISIAVYRLYINPLRKFPGSKLGALTKWTHFSLTLTGRTHHVMKKRHRELGDFVRIGPNEISIADPSFIPIVHGNKSRFPKGPWYEHMTPDPEPALIGILDYDAHKTHRKVWDEVFTPRALRVYEGRITPVLDSLVARFDEAAENRELVDIAEWSERLLADTTGKIALNVDFHSVKDEQGHFYLKFIKATLKYVSTMGEVSWVKPLLQLLPLNKVQNADMKKFQEFGVEMLKRRMESEGSAEIDAMGFLMTAGRRNPSLKLSVQGLEAETRLVISAGTDTTSIAVTSAMYWLLLDKTAYKKLRTECRKIFAPEEEFDANRLGDWKRAPYLNGCVQEALRLLPSGPNGNQRVVNTPGGIMTPDGLHIPQGTKVSIPEWTVHHDPRNFEKPWDFIPERWIEGSDFQGVHNATAFIPFSLGSYSCIGKPLALLQMRLFLYRMIQRFDFELCPGFDKREFIDGTKGWFGLTKLPLVVSVARASE